MPKRRIPAVAKGAFKVRIPLLCRFLGCLHDELLDALRRQASEKRQGTKSRSGWGGLAAVRYGPKLPTWLLRNGSAIKGYAVMARTLVEQRC